MEIMTQKSFEEVRSIIDLHRGSASRGVNREFILMNWEIGAYISARLKSNEWGSKVVTELSEYLRIQDPSLKGYSRRNLYNMVAFYEAYSNPDFLKVEQNMIGDKIKKLQTNQIVQMSSAQIQKGSRQIVQMNSAQLPTPPQLLFLTTFSNHMEIINRCKTNEERLFYILYSFKENLKFEELKRCIQTDTFSTLLGDKKNLSKGLKEIYPSADHSVVEYAMSRSMSPTMVAEYKRLLIPQDVVAKNLNEYCAFAIEGK